MPPFKIGITMAGAVSAGAYTAGVIDYLLETLALWEKAKQRNRDLKIKYPNDYLTQGYDASIPMHDVSLEVISGASAGGITGTLTLLSLLGEIQAVNKDNPEGKNNKLYEAWVNMADDKDGEDTFSKMMHLEDIKEDDEVRSLLNATVMDTIADKSLNIQQFHTLPPYVAKDIDLILTISNLKGIQYLINFEGRDDGSGTIITNHSGFFRYRIKNENLEQGIPKNGAPYYVLDLTQDGERKYLKAGTLSTASFPIGLPSRESSIPREYLERYTSYIFGRDKGIQPISDKDSYLYRFIATDGGLINNEPFGYALRILKEKCPEMEEKGNFGMIMIDPFPNYSKQVKSTVESKTDILSVAISVFGALRNQVMFRQDEILNAIDENNNTRFLVAPVRRYIDGEKKGQRAENPIASGALGGFSGFLDKRFRKHDFHLGRQNCQSFLRYHFALPKDKASDKLGVAYEPEAINRFGFTRPIAKESGAWSVPIIPDIRVLRAFNNLYDTNTFGEDAALPYTAFPSLTIRDFDMRYGKAVKKRLGVIMGYLMPTTRFWLVNWLGRRWVYRKLKKIIEGALNSNSY